MVGADAKAILSYPERSSLPIEPWRTPDRPLRAARLLLLSAAGAGPSAGLVQAQALPGGAVSEPRAVLAEFGTIIPDDVEIHVSDSTAMVRYLVLPKRPDGTNDYSEEQLAALVTRDTMIGVVPVSIDTGRISR
jgi:Nitrile hydratase, alpha chain